MELRADSVNIEDIIAKAEKMAQSVLAERSKAFGGMGEVDVAFFPDIGIIGYRIRDLDLAQVSAGDLHAASAQVAGGMQEFARSDAAIAVIGNGGATMGFFPVDTVVLRNLR